MRAIPHQLDHMQKIVGGYIEVTRRCPDLPCGCPMVMVINEEGVIMNLPLNRRAMEYYPGPIVGDVFLVGEGLVKGHDELEDIEFFSLPSTYHEWEGPGHPFPAQKQSWE
jgi:hypothetical protein